jgi:V/A-type H+-transporting ATPase subunit K
MKLRPALLYPAIAIAASIGAAFIVVLLSPPDAATAAEAAAGLADPGVAQWGLLAAAIAAGLATLGAGYAVAIVGSAAVGALAEKPELLGRVLIFVGLAEGIAIYGLIVAILILDRVE